jgi:hypothetical protein
VAAVAAVESTSADHRGYGGVDSNKRSITAAKEAGVEVPIPGIQDIQKGSDVKVRKAGQGERGTWRVLGEVANSGPDDPAYDLTNLVSGRRRIFRASRLTVVRGAVPGRR